MARFCSYTLVSVAVGVGICPLSSAMAQEPLATTASQCYANQPPALLRKAPTAALAQQPVYASAQQMAAERVANGPLFRLHYAGNVQISHEQRRFAADEATFDQAAQVLTASGHIRYEDEAVLVTSQDQLKAQLATQEATLSDTEYHLKGSPVRGYAQTLHIEQQQRVQLTGAKYTTCQAQDEAWSLRAQHIELNQADVFGEARHASLWFYGIPVFYFPYINFPIQDQRKTGLLYPDINYNSNNGLDFAQPWYWNIAPALDATLTERLIERRGLLHGGEFRYLTATQQGTLYGEYLPEDRLSPEGGDRYFVAWRHQGRFDNNRGHIRLNYEHVKDQDLNYFNDLDSPIALDEMRLSQGGSISWQKDHLSLRLLTQRYQLLQGNSLGSHQVMPQAQLTYRVPLQANLTTYSSFDVARFTYNPAANEYRYYEGNRLHGESGLNWTLANTPGYNVHAEGSLLATYYNQVNYGAKQVDEHVSRVIPTARVYGSWIFEQPLAGGTHTVEPQWQYAYIPYRDQSGIGWYDTHALRTDYAHLFSLQRFSGIDRIAETNRISLGVTQRWYNSAGVERARLAIGYAQELATQTIELYRTPVERLWAVEADAVLNRHWMWRGAAQLNPTDGELLGANTALEYTQGAVTAQLNYRYLDEVPLDTAAPWLGTESIDQAGIMLALPLTEGISVYGTYYRDLRQHSSSDRLIGLSYDSCCWKINLIAEWANKADNVSLQPYTEQSIGIQFELKGLGSVGNSDRPSLFDTRNLPYTRPFNLTP